MCGCPLQGGFLWVLVYPIPTLPITPLSLMPRPLPLQILRPPWTYKTAGRYTISLPMENIYTVMEWTPSIQYPRFCINSWSILVEPCICRQGPYQYDQCLYVQYHFSAPKNRCKVILKILLIFEYPSTKYSIWFFYWHKF